ncbi:MAG: prolyl-tRNA synthetase [Mycoplasmataceae bacterium RV_VA103A]|nr:MAG: prolyl-tRNA synthetase [Mycoplasmataceae bacterium RV_VA103A]
MEKEKTDKYSRLLNEGGLFFYGATKGSFILPPHGYALWKNIQSALEKKFASHGVQNVLLPTLIPLDLLEKEKEHVAGFSPECFYVERIGAKKIETPLVLRPTSEIVFYDWYRQILHSYRQLPLLYNQWCSVFRAEKNTTPFFRNTEFLWQEGHTLHANTQEARQFTLNILSDYQDYAENILCLGVIVGQKTAGEKFAGALETYTVECLLPDGQCLQLATSHYFGDNFCRLMEVKFQNKDNQMQHPFSTSWGTSTRAIGALVKAHADQWGLILPFEIAPVQIAFILIGESPELIDYYQEIYGLLSRHYRCQLYNKNKQVNANVLQADQEGCPFKMIIGKQELEHQEITLIRRDNVERKITIKLEENELEKKYITATEKYWKEMSEINQENKKEFEKAKVANPFRQGQRAGKIFGIISQEAQELQKNLYQKSVEFRDKHIFSVANLAELEKKKKDGSKGLFLVPFCNNLDCELKIKEKVPSYSIRCIAGEERVIAPQKCLFCQSAAQNRVYLGRSY